MGPAVPQLNRTTSAGIVERAGMPQLRQLNMVNTKMFRHPKYYKELRKRNKSDQAISEPSSTEQVERAPGPGLRGQAKVLKRQASSAKLRKHQATSVKPQATSVKLKATSVKLQDS